jgi:hypothetical protein
MRRTRRSATKPATAPVRVPAARSGATGAKRAVEAERVPAFHFARVRVHAAHSHRLEVDPLAPGSVAPHTEDVVPLDSGGGSGEQAKDKAPQRPGPKCAEALQWTPESPVPVEIVADSVADFAAKVAQALGGTPHMAAEASWDLESNNGKVDKTNAELKTTIIRPRYGGGRASDQEKALIKRAVQFIKEHEERHRDIARAAYQQAICDALGKSLTAANAVFEKTRCQTEPDAQAALDAKEGKLEWVQDKNGNVVDFKAVGVKAAYRPQDCKKK